MQIITLLEYSTKWHIGGFFLCLPLIKQQKRENKKHTYTRLYYYYREISIELTISHYNNSHIVWSFVCRVIGAMNLFFLILKVKSLSHKNNGKNPISAVQMLIYFFVYRHAFQKRMDI